MKYCIMLVISTGSGGITSQIIPGFYNDRETAEENAIDIRNSFAERVEKDGGSVGFAWLILPYCG